MLNQKLSEILGTPIRTGQLRQNLVQLDKMGAISKKVQLDMLIALCEVVDALENNEKTTNNKVSV